jgi:hypothetical protein
MPPLLARTIPSICSTCPDVGTAVGVPGAGVEVGVAVVVSSATAV